MEIKYSKNALWLKPYVDSAKNLVDLDKVRSVKGYRVAINKKPQCDGRTTQWYMKRRRIITIRIWEAPADIHLRSRYEDILVTLAHELAHIPYWDHTPDHFKLVGKLMVKFAKILERENILDTSSRFSPKIEQKHIEKHEQMQETKLS